MLDILLLNVIYMDRDKHAPAIDRIGCYRCIRRASAAISSVDSRQEINRQSPCHPAFLHIASATSEFL